MLSNAPVLRGGLLLSLAKLEISILNFPICFGDGENDLSNAFYKLGAVSADVPCLHQMLNLFKFSQIEFFLLLK